MRGILRTDRWGATRLCRLSEPDPTFFDRQGRYFSLLNSLSRTVSLVIASLEQSSISRGIAHIATIMGSFGGFGAPPYKRKRVGDSEPSQEIASYSGRMNQRPSTTLPGVSSLLTPLQAAGEIPELQVGQPLWGTNIPAFQTQIPCLWVQEPAVFPPLNGYHQRDGLASPWSQTESLFSSTTLRPIASDPGSLLRPSPSHESHIPQHLGSTSQRWNFPVSDTQSGGHSYQPGPGNPQGKTDSQGVFSSSYLTLDPREVVCFGVVS